MFYIQNLWHDTCSQISEQLMNEHGIKYLKKKIIKEWNNTVRMADSSFFYAPADLLEGSPTLHY